MKLNWYKFENNKTTLIYQKLIFANDISFILKIKILVIISISAFLLICITETETCKNCCSWNQVEIITLLNVMFNVWYVKNGFHPERTNRDVTINETSQQKNFQKTHIRKVKHSKNWKRFTGSFYLIST